MLRDMTFPGPIKSLLRVSAFALCGFVGTIFADDFKSLTFDASSPQTIRVHGDQVMLIRNFTQEGTGSTRGTVIVTSPPSSTTSVSVLAAAILDMPSIEVINSVVIAGPADVTFNCGTGGGNCFVSFKKIDNN